MIVNKNLRFFFIADPIRWSLKLKTASERSVSYPKRVSCTSEEFEIFFTLFFLFGG
jgi:hypothetical protein